MCKKWSMHKFSYEEALSESLKYFDGDDLAAKVVVDKYLLRDNENNLKEKSPTDLHRRIASEYARIEKDKFKVPLSEEQIFSYLDKFSKIIPQGSLMFGVGNSYQYTTLSNCYVISSPLDSYAGILKTDEELVQISKRRGGTGLDISNIRPNGSCVKNAARTSTGIIPFMERYSNSIREVGQGGRRGALMITISVHHPEILEFANIKRDLKKITGANISIRLTDEFLEAVSKDKEYEQRWPVDSNKPLISQKVRAKDIWKQIIENAHAMAEPGLLFWDKIIKESPADCYSGLGFNTVATNPCQPSYARVQIKGKEGYSIFGDIKIGDEINAVENNKIIWTKVLNKWSNGIKKVFCYKTENIGTFIGTENHEVFQFGQKIKVKNATHIDIWFNGLCEGDCGIRTEKIIDIKYLGEEEVFDITVDNTSHSYWTDGCIVSNCSELPLCVFDSCRLMVINLFTYINHPFTKDALFDYDTFNKDSQILQRLMDDTIDLELECIDKIISKIKNDPESKDIKLRELELWINIRTKCENGRRTGSGITGLGDTLAALNIEYGSKESIEETEKIYKTLKLACYRSSVNMAKELGAFPIWDAELERSNPFLLRIKDEDPELYKDMNKYGRRNIALLTTAPTGSVSILTQTTSGIEPLFMISYKRRKKVNHNDKNAKIDFVDPNGDSWEEFLVYHPKVKLWMEITGEKDTKKSPWHNCCAEDLNWVDRVNLQAVAQKHIDHAISSTLNLPENISVNKVAEIYETAWKMGCKGITIYRKNCRAGVLIEDLSGQLPKTNAPKRPKSLLCDVHHFTVKSHRYYTIIGLFNNEPYEVFIGNNHDKDGEIIIPKTVKNGKIIKRDRGHYCLQNDELNKEFKLTNGHSDDNLNALTRLISLGLRHGASVDFVCHQIEKVEGEMNSMSKLIARTLKQYISDGTKVHGEECPNCKSNALIRQDGCVSCKSCSWTKCQ